MWARGALYAAWQGLRGWDGPRCPPVGNRGEVLAYGLGRAAGVGLAALVCLAMIVGVWWLAMLADGGL